MNILIIENEIYLAQKVVSRLLDDGHSCDYIESPNINNLTKDYDIVLLSTSLPSSLCKTIMRLLKNDFIEFHVLRISLDRLLPSASRQRRKNTMLDRRSIKHIILPTVG